MFLKSGEIQLRFYNNNYWGPKNSLKLEVIYYLQIELLEDFKTFIMF